MNGQREGWGVWVRVYRGGVSYMRSFKALAAMLLVMAGLSVTFDALGAPDPIDLGIAWLQTQVLSNGQVSQSSSAADEQTQCETAKTLVSLAGGNPNAAALITGIQSSASTATQSLACQRYLQSLLGLVPTSTLDDRTVSTGGYAAYPGQTSASLLDTSWALQSELQNLAPTERANFITWLRTQQNADGSFSQRTGASLLTTANILLGLSSVPTFLR
jgi:hypothetical protein